MKRLWLVYLLFSIFTACGWSMAIVAVLQALGMGAYASEISCFASFALTVLFFLALCMLSATDGGDEDD